MRTQALIVKAERRETQIDPLRVVVIAMNTDLVRDVAAKRGLRSVGMSTAGGSPDFPRRLTRRFDRQNLFGAEVKVGIDQIVSLDMRQAKANVSVDLKPVKYEYTPFLGVRWNYETDRSWLGVKFGLAEMLMTKDRNALGESAGLRGRRAVPSIRNRPWALTTDRTGGSVRVRVLVDGTKRVATIRN